jgi:hypothetical protein
LRTACWTMEHDLLLFDKRLDLAKGGVMGGRHHTDFMLTVNCGSAAVAGIALLAG